VNALRLHAPGDVRLHEEPPPIPAAGDVLVRVTAVGLCGSDRHWFVNGGIGDAALADPLVLGHEFVGVVESGPLSGRRVAVDPAITCGRCTQCLAGRPNLCTEVEFAGHSRDGALRSLMAWPEHLLHPLPDTLPDVEAALLEPLGVAVHAVDLGRVRPGTSAAVLGCGPIGLLIVRLLRAVGATPITASDPLPHRAAAAEAAGAVLARPEEVDVVFDATDEDTAEQAIAAARSGGRVVLVGIPSNDRTTFTASAARRKGLTILLCRRMQPVDLGRALRLVDSGAVSVDSLVSERFALSEAQEAFTALVERRGLKIVVEPQRPQ
jgi:L-iditol 2-dehydrogenase